MRITPENTILEEEFTDELDYVKVWDDAFPVIRGDNVKARHVNALWAALTERGRLVGLQVHDWTIGDSEPGSGSGGSIGSAGNEWEFPVKGAVRPDDEIYWDGFKNQDDDEAITASGVEGQHIQDLLIAIHEVCQRYMNPDEGRGFLGLGDLMAYLMIGKLEEEGEDQNWPFDQISGSDHDYDAWSFPTVPDRTEAASELRQERIEEEAEAQGETAPEVTDEQEQAQIDDRFWYTRFDPTPGSTIGRQTIRINDPRFVDGGGGFGEAQYTLWDFFSPGDTSVPENIAVKISSNPLGEDPEDDDETVQIPLTPFHEHINAVYYMIRALEWITINPDTVPGQHQDLDLQNDGARADVVGIVVCKIFQLPAETFIEEWNQFVIQRLSLPLKNPQVFTGASPTLFAQARQETFYQCPVFGPIGPRLWVASNIKASRFVSYIPVFKPWDSDYEQEEFPGGFASPKYTVNTIKVWLRGSGSTTQATADGSGAAQNGWGGDALLMLEEGEIGTLNSNGDIVGGEQIGEIAIDGPNVSFDISSETIVTAKLPETVADLESEDGVYHLHFNLDPGKFNQINSPNNQAPRIESPDGVGGKNFTQSTVLADILSAVKFTEHTYSGGRVSFSDMEL